MDWNYEDFIGAIFQLIGIDLSLYKERQMKRRIDSLISRNHYKGYHEYYLNLLENKDILEEFIDYLTINVSEFYRNPNQWEVLEKELLPDILKKYPKIKIWSAACSTGEEPYSLVMLLNQYLPLKDIHILATDIDKNALQKARLGQYIFKSLEALPVAYIHKYFDKRDEKYFVKEELKKCIDFQQHNLLNDPFPTGNHLILCRNVMIYFTEEAKNTLYRKFSDALYPEDGILFVGSTEQIILPHRYQLAAVKTFFYKRIR